MSAVGAAIDARKAAGRGALIGYLPIGFPNLHTSVDAAVAIAENGFDIIELGVPYSDPVMDGPVIQKATQAALADGFRLSHAFEAVAAITARTDVPVVLMTYWNPVLQYGVDRFVDDLVGAGGAGLITPDLIPDDAQAWFAAADRTDVDRIFLAAPSSTNERLAMIAEHSRGFVYAASTMGITGARSAVDGAARELTARLRTAGAARVCVGLGISTADQVQEVLQYADGAIVGSALVTALSSGGVAELARAASALAVGTRLN